MKKKYKLLPIILIVISFFVFQEKASACHALALININQQNPVVGGIEVRAASTNPTCGCGVYWLDLEVRCMNEAFNGAAFNPANHLALATYPFFQSATMLKPNCIVQNYPWVTIPFTTLCPGMTYQYRMRENNNGNAGPWSAAQTFTVPGASQPIVAAANATQTTICNGDCINLTSSVVLGCNLAATYTWDNGLGNGQNKNNICPTASTTYCVTITEACSGFSDQACVTVNVTAPPVNGTATVNPANFCNTTNPTLTLAGNSGIIQWQSAPNNGGPWINIIGGNTTPFNPPQIQASTCYRAEITGCGTGGPTTLYSNIVCVTYNGAALANFIAPSVCDGATTVFTNTSTPIGTISSWAWDFNNDGIVDNNTQNPTNIFPGPGTYNVELLVSSPGGCLDSILIPAVVNPIPMSSFSATTECLGTASTFTDLSNISTGNITGWAWDFGDGVGTSVSQNPTYTYTNSGIYNVSLTVTSDSGCTNTFTTNIQVFEIPIANFTPNTACAGANSLFGDISTLGSSGIQFWNWDFDNDGVVDNTTQNPIYIFPAGFGTYPVNLNIIDSNGCFHDTTLNVSVSAQPTAAFTFTNECFGTATGFTDLSTPNGGVITNWDWDFQDDGTVDDINQNPTNGYPSAGNYIAELLVTTALGCTDSITMPIVVNPIPVAGFSVPGVCFGTSSFFTDTSNIITGNIVSWQWNFGDNAGTSIVQNPNYTYTNPGAFPVTLTVTSDSGCINTIIDSAIVHFLPTAAFTTNDVCLNVAASFADNSNPNGGIISNWDWDFNGNGITDDTNQNPSNLYSADGTYNVGLIVSTAFGCADTIIQPITIFPMPSADFTFINACYGTAIAFTDNSAVSSGTISGWNWNFGNGNTSIMQTPSENYLSEGVYNVVLIATTDNSCQDTISKNIEVWPIPVVNFSPTDVCLTTPTQFNDLTTVSNNSTTNNIVQWLWNFGDGGSSTAQNPVYTYLNDGTYQAQLSVVSNNGCVKDSTLTITVNPLPQVSFGADTLSGCNPVIVNFGDSTQINAPGILTSWSWDFGNGITSNQQNPNGIVFENLSNTTVATFSVSLAVTSDKGCVIKDSIANMISVFPIPVAAFNFGPEYSDIYDREVAFTDQSIIASVWNWDLGDGSTSTSTNPIHEYPDSGNYLVTLFIENQYGCKDTTDKLVRINPVYAIWIPNVFTPDGDGINDFFSVSGFGIIEKQMLIYDRWGILFYEGYQMDSKWDGIYKGSIVQQDVYVYKIRVKDVFNVWHDYIGRVSVLR